MTEKRSTEGGAALVTALVLLVVLGTVSTLTLERSRQVAESTVDQRVRLQLVHAADGGLAHARHTLAQNPQHKGAELLVGSCDVKTEVERHADRWLVQIEANLPAVRQGRFSAQVELKPTDGLPSVVSWSER